MSYHVNTKDEAWGIVDKMMPHDYEPDPHRSALAGYAVYSDVHYLYPRSYGDDPANDNWAYCYVNDLESRLEVCLNGNCTNIWIDN